MRIGVVTFPGTLDDGDAVRAVRLAGGTPVALWHASDDVGGVDAVVLPGGFSYGDYLRYGAIAALTPVMSAAVEAAAKGVPVLGICNGFQILCEAHLLPGRWSATRGSASSAVSKSLRSRTRTRRGPPVSRAGRSSRFR